MIWTYLLFGCENMLKEFHPELNFDWQRSEGKMPDRKKAVIQKYEQFDES